MGQLENEAVENVVRVRVTRCGQNCIEVAVRQSRFFFGRYISQPLYIRDVTDATTNTVSNLANPNVFSLDFFAAYESVLFLESFHTFQI